MDRVDEIVAELNAGQGHLAASRAVYGEIHPDGSNFFDIAEPIHHLVGKGLS